MFRTTNWLSMIAFVLLYGASATASAFIVELNGTIDSTDFGFNSGFRTAALGSNFSLVFDVDDSVNETAGGVPTVDSATFLEAATFISFDMGGYSAVASNPDAGTLQQFGVGSNFSAQGNFEVDGPGVARNVIGPFLFPDRAFISLIRDGYISGEADSLNASSYSDAPVSGNIEFRFSGFLGAGRTFDSVHGTLDSISVVPVPAAIWLFAPALAFLIRCKK